MQIPAFIHLPGNAPMPAPRHGSAIFGALARLAGAVWARLRAWHETRRTLEEVATLDEATLRDIGVSRYDLEAAVHAARHRDAARSDAYWGRR
jgi:uncharacterized protein YjiS (DUF1127 family)